MTDEEYDRVYQLGRRAGWNDGVRYGEFAQRARDVLHTSEMERNKYDQLATEIARRKIAT